jgi:hypothetical protein
MATRVRGSASLKVLFIGNSFTARNDLPGLVAKLAAARGKTVEHRLISAGGASLRTHWNAGQALKAIQSGEYDHVVLQEQSTLPVKNAKRMHENVRLFDEATKAAGARTVLYMTWARQHEPESQQVITDAYASIGRELGASVVPVGLTSQRRAGPRQVQCPSWHEHASPGRDLSSVACRPTSLWAPVGRHTSSPDNRPVSAPGGCPNDCSLLPRV